MKQLRLWVLLLSVCLLAGCRERESKAVTEQKPYQIYYLNSGGTRLVGQPYQTETTDTDLLIEELMAQFLTVPADVDCQAALTDKVTYQDYKQEETVLYLYFDSNYTSMKPEREILCRAALVKTLTQVPEIAYINVYSADQPLMDTRGNPIGIISAGDLIEGISDINAFERTEITLYFTDEDGEQLLEERREVIYNTNTSKERLIVEELIKGPAQDDLFPTLSADVRLLNISVTENVCYLNFDAAFLSQALEVKEYIPIYSLVNSLLELSTVSRVQITVNGSADVVFRDSIPLNTMFERNLDYIGGEGN